MNPIMELSRHVIYLLLLCLLVGVWCSPTAGQNLANGSPAVVVSDDIKQSLITLNAGDTEAAITALKKITKARAADGDAWHYLGLAYKQKGDRGGARKAFQRAFELRSEMATQSLYSPARTEQLETKELLEARGRRVASELEAAAVSLDLLISVDPKAAKKFAQRVDNFPAFIEDLRSGKAAYVVGAVYSAKDVDEKAVVTSRPEPGYSQEAREKNVSGEITVRLILAADGRIRFPVIVKGLGYGLDQQALRAARAIKFTPARKDGRPVSQLVMVKYSFYIF